MTGAPSSRHNDGVRVILSITSIKLACQRRAGYGARGRVLFTSTSATSAQQLAVTRFPWTKLACAVAVVSICRRLPYTEGHLVQPCQSHTVLNARRLLVYRPISSSSFRLHPRLQLHLARHGWLGCLLAITLLSPARHCLSFCCHKITRLSPYRSYFDHHIDPRACETPA